MLLWKHCEFIENNFLLLVVAYFQKKNNFRVGNNFQKDFFGFCESSVSKQSFRVGNDFK